ncbi:RNA methyltransferase [Pseudomonas sp. NW5]|uniref:RNA methyltransferase n=1 Tax=Pseudomonas sp. NW5 TaxID=2934934 RepID=UPI002020A61F|nr:RNA methyltransferase [Pseudomonas sp. NW5]MCL7463070.1 RNA methyltransferase [Pseudomonas sp. NW5]
MQINDLLAQLRAHGAQPCHQQRILRAWLAGLPLDSGPRNRPPQDFFPRRVREALPHLALSLQQLARLHSQHPAADGSARLLVGLADRQMVESVLLPRDGLCVSTQVGCAVGCVFCMTGRSGLLRQLSSAEILAQVALARQQRAVKKVVFMGMGEPAHNLDNVLEAITWLGSEGGIGHKNLVFSTVGDPRVFERLPRGPVKPALALSLHSTRAELRRTLLPQAAALTPEQLVEQGERYARATGYPIQYQWTLLKGINDSVEEMDGILRLLKGKYAVMNLIPYNSLEGDAFQRPDGERIVQMVRYLHSRGVLTKVRNSAGQDIDGGCGQLRARAEGRPLPRQRRTPPSA